MARKYLKIKIEEKEMFIDLSVLSSDQVEFSIGKMEGKDNFIPENVISLDELEAML